MFIVYILYSSSLDKYYIGQTNNLERRLHEHNSGQAIFTRTGKPWILVFTKEFMSRSDSMAFERKLKSMKSKEYLDTLIKNA